jgi:hypothetical protein
MSVIYYDFERFDSSGSSSRVSGRLKMGAASYTALSGGYGKGFLPSGHYTVRTRNVVVGDATPVKAYTVGSAAFFIPIEPQFTTSRSGFGIHPDGNTTGTLGCIGLLGAAAADFWRAWMALELDARPTTLIVRSNITGGWPNESATGNA